MFKEIINRFARRRKIADDSMELSAVKELLASLNGVTMINVDYDCCCSHMAFRNKTPTDVAEFLEKEFKPLDTIHYCEINHQAFSEKEGERHYICLQKGSIETSIGTQELRNKPFKKVTLDYVLETKI